MFDLFFSRRALSLIEMSSSLFFSEVSLEMNPSFVTIRENVSNLLRVSQPSDQHELGTSEPMRAAHGLLKTVLGGKLR